MVVLVCVSTPLLRLAIARPDVEVILRSGRVADLLGGLESLNLDIVLLNQAPAADAAAPFVSHLIATQGVSLVGRLGPAEREASLCAAFPLPGHPADKGKRGSPAVRFADGAP